MPAETQDLNKFLENTENLYEAAMVIAKRSRQINEELFQKKRDRQILEELEGEFEEEFLHTEEEKIEIEEPVEAEENPMVTAQREFLNLKLDFHYEPVKR
ncbi:MAG: DNA-directed RNA polymerase subunit omega [Calditrichia bacterium]